jgi:hypothetical protein
MEEVKEAEEAEEAKRDPSFAPLRMTPVPLERTKT